MDSNFDRLLIFSFIPFDTDPDFYGRGNLSPLEPDNVK